MKVRLTLGWVVVLSLVAAIGYAQSPARTLSLSEALEIARRNNPDYRSALNDRWSAGIQNTSSTLSMFLPSADLSASRSRSAAGRRSPGNGIPPQTYPAVTSYDWSLGVQYGLSGRTFANRGLAAANLRAVEQDIAGAQTTLETGVRSQYLLLLELQAREDLARRSLDRVTENLNLARARHSVGQGTLIDVRRAEVDKGRADVALMQAEQATQNQVLSLFQTLGVPAPAELRVQLTDSFPVTEPAWQQEQLVQQALEQNPGLLSLRARNESARWNVRAARSQFLPSLFFSAGLGGNRLETLADTNARDSLGVPITSGPLMPVSEKSSSPFRFTIGVSLPLFEPLSRNVGVQQARADADDLRQQIRARELNVRAAVTSAYQGLLIAYRTIDVERAGRAAATEALELATQRYRVGSGTYLELLDARLAADQADEAYVRAVYTYHRAIATLENAVGRPLR